MNFHSHQLPNGLRVLGESAPGVHSVAVGFFVRTGARDETADVSGVSHFLEHMVFKGTARHSAEDVNRVFDEVGAKYNASTGEESTLFYAAVLPEYLPRTFDLLADIMFPALREEDFLTEKNVILEEIGMYDDQPPFIAYDTAMSSYFAGHPLGQSILGTVNSITELPVEKMRAYHRQQYSAGNIVLAVTGRFEWESILELAQKHCSHWPKGNPARQIPVFQPGESIKVVHRPQSQMQHTMLLSLAPTARSGSRFAAELLSVVVGDETGSRIFWSMVDPGHAESADLGYNEFDGVGTWLTYVGSTPEEMPRNLDRLQAIFDDVNRNGVTDEELRIARSKMSVRTVLRSERPMGRLGGLGSNWLYRQEYRSLDDDLAAIAAVTQTEIRQLLDEFPLGRTSTVTIGPLESL